MAAACALRLSLSQNVRDATNLHCQVRPHIHRICNNTTVHRSLLSTDINDTNSGRKPDLKLSQNSPISRNVTTEAIQTAFPAETEIPDNVLLKYLDTTFSNSEEAYRSKRTAELLRALFVFRVTSFEPLVKHNMQVRKLVIQSVRKLLCIRLIFSQCSSLVKAVV